MQPENWKKVKALLDDVLLLEPSARRPFLEKSGASTEIREEVESLLAFEEESESLMRLSAVEFSMDFFDEDAANPLIGQTIGNYRITGELGYGGMGAVFLAERADGKFEQKVALKLLKREMNTSALRRRFQHEQEILASLEHPNIARLLDAGTTDDRIPFLAMEYVEGVPIDEFCRVQNLDLDERLDLFRKVCAAVSFAHRNLVVHRDLKPSNILVNPDGIPKLLDFGIAKILSAELAQANSATVTRLGVMTPSYASPEQLQNKSVTTATDIYSLGVILYELLSGHRPFETKEGDLKEIYKAVIETEPAPPSATISNFKLQISNSKPAVLNQTENQNQQTHPKSEIPNPKSIMGDLDNIVLKALRKEPERRYSSAENLAEDIHRHQRGLPVSARPNTLSYRFEKFFKRNKPTVFASLLIVIAIIAGIVATVWQARAARIERARAEKRFNDVRALANSFLFEFSPKIENLPGSMPARQLLVTRAREYLDNLSQESASDSQLQNELAKAYEKVGDVQGNPQTPNIGDLQGALESYEKAQAIRRRLLQSDAESAEKQAALAGNLEVTANINLNGGEFDKAETSLAEAVALREKVVAANPQDSAARASLGYAVRTSSYVPFYNSQPEKAMELSRRALEIFAELSRELPDDAFINMQHANVYIDLGEGYAYLDNAARAQENILKGSDMLASVYEKHPNDNRVRRSLFVSLLKSGELFRDAGETEKSLARYERALVLAQLAMQTDTGSFQAKRDLVVVNKQHAATLNTAKRFQESIESFSRAIEISEQLKREDPSNIIVVYDIGGSYYDLSEVYFTLGDYASALSAAEKAQANCSEVLAKNPAHTQSKNVTGRAKLMVGKVYTAYAEKNGQTDSWKTALENFRAGLEIFNNLKAEGKFTPLDAKRIADLEPSIAKAESRVN
jgi:non-specific serine/threonine protein kinase/serine/threonine-protein kinase